MNLGNIDMVKLAGYAKAQGISKEELDTALAAHHISTLCFSSAGC